MVESDGSELSGELTIHGTSESATFPEIPDAVIEALHKSIVGDRQHMDVRKHESKVVSIDDVRLLCESVKQWMSGYIVKSDRFRIIITHSDPETGAIHRDNFSDVDSLLRYDAANTQPTQSVEIYYSIVLERPKGRGYHQLDAVVELNRADPTMEINWNDQGFGGISFKSPAQFQVKIEYSEYLSAKNLFTTISEWYRQLADPVKKSKPSRFSRLFHGSDKLGVDRADLFASTLSSILSVFIAVGIFRSFLAEMGVTGLAYAAFVHVVLSQLISVAFRLFGQRYKSYLVLGGPAPNLRFNRGDDRKLEEYNEKKDEKIEKAKFWRNVIIASLFVNVLAGFVVNYWWSLF